MASTLLALAIFLHSSVFGQVVSSLALMPNPFSPNGDGFRDVVHVKFQTTEAGSLLVRVFDISGREVRRLLNTQTQAGQSWDITWDGLSGDGSNLLSGIYIIFVDLNGSHQKAKVVLRR